MVTIRGIFRFMAVVFDVFRRSWVLRRVKRLRVVRSLTRNPKFRLLSQWQERPWQRRQHFNSADTHSHRKHRNFRVDPRLQVRACDLQLTGALRRAMEKSENLFNTVAALTLQNSEQLSPSNVSRSKIRVEVYLTRERRAVDQVPLAFLRLQE